MPWLIGAGAAFALLVVAALVMGRGRAPAPMPRALQPQLVAGARVGDLERSFAEAEGISAGALSGSTPAAVPQLPPDPREVLRERAVELATQDPARAAHVLKGWMTEGGSNG